MPSPRHDEATDLPTPAVDPSLYDEHYFVEEAAGGEEWAASGAAAVDGRFPGHLYLAELRPGEVVVDIGTGRGELLVAALEKGASRAIGVDYAETAVDMARRTVAAHGGDPRAEVRLADARRLPVDDATADLVTLLDVVEHLSPEELARTLAEARRVLKPGGRIWIHTLPSRLIYTVTYRVMRVLWLGALRGWPADPRHDYERSMHVNEQTCGSLRRSLDEAGFTDVRAWPGDWFYAEFVPSRTARRAFRELSKRRATRRLGMANIFASGRASALSSSAPSAT